MPPPSDLNGVSHLLALPNETLENIARCMVPLQLSADDNMKESRRDLRSLSLVSKRLNDITTCFLYSHIHIHSWRQMYRLVLRLLTEPSLFSSIHKLALSPTICCCACHAADSSIKSGERYLCNNLAWLVCNSFNLKELLLNLKECKECWQGRENWQNNLVPNVGYRIFYQSFSLEAYRYHEPNFRFLPKLSTIYVASSRSQATLVNFSSLFSIPSLQNFICLQDPGEGWKLHPRHVGGYTPIKTFDLRRTALTPAGICKFCKVFPKLQVLSITNDRAWTCNLSEGQELWEIEESKKMNISSNLARMTELTQLSLNCHMDFKNGNDVLCTQALGPSGGITGLAGLERLTKLTIGMHFLMHYINYTATGSSGARPLSPEVLPSSLREFQLYTCFSCWYPEDAEPAESTLAFLNDLTRKVDRFPNLEKVLYSCEAPWWVGYRMDPRTSHRRKDEKTGEIWFAGCLASCAISFSASGVYFRARESSTFTCADHSLEGYL